MLLVSGTIKYAEIEKEMKSIFPHVQTLNTNSIQKNLF